MTKFIKTFFSSLGLILAYLFTHYFSLRYIPNILHFVTGLFLAFFLLHLTKVKKSTCITLCLLEIVLLASILFLIHYSTFFQPVPTILNFFQTNQTQIFILLGTITTILFTKIYHI